LSGRRAAGQESFLEGRPAQKITDLDREGKSVKAIARIFGVRSRRVQKSLNAITSQESEVGTGN